MSTDQSKELPYANSNREAAEQVCVTLTGAPNYNIAPVGGARAVDLLNGFEDLLASLGEIDESPEPLTPEDKRKFLLGKLIKAPADMLALMHGSDTLKALPLTQSDFKESREVEDGYTVGKYFTKDRFPELSTLWGELTSEEFITGQLRPALIQYFTRRKDELQGYIDNSSLEGMEQVYKAKDVAAYRYELPLIQQTLQILTQRVTQALPD